MDNTYSVKDVIVYILPRINPGVIYSELLQSYLCKSYQCKIQIDFSNQFI